MSDFEVSLITEKASAFELLVAANELRSSMNSQFSELWKHIDRLHGELEGQWEHIRNLETSLMSPQEYQKSVNKIANNRHDQVVSAMAGGPAVKPNCY